MRLFAIAAWLGVTVGCAVEGSIGAHEGTCGTCHVEHSERFETSAHAQAGTTPLFVALRDAMPGDAALCDTCHLPEVGSDTGLSCTTCHAAHGNREVGNGALMWDLDGPVRGPFDDPDPARPHAAVQSAFLQDSQLCGTCHDQDRLAAFTESPWQHWRDSPAAAEGVGCQDCHMSSAPGVDRATLPPVTGTLVPRFEDLPVRPLSDHGFVGISAQSDPSEATALIARAVDLRGYDDGPDRVVTITNAAAGHDLPDGASFLRELWLGPADGSDRRWLSAALRSADGREVVSPADAATVEPRGLPAGTSRTERFPGAGTTICLWYRPVRRELAEQLGLPIPEATAVRCDQ